jgi:predicted acyltransferase (DUF342 family)
MSFNTSITGGAKCPTFTFNSTTVEATNGVFENVTATNGNFVNLTGTTFNPSNITTNILSANVGNIIDFTSTDATLTNADITTANVDTANITTANITDVTIDSLEVENGIIDNQLIINDTIDTGLTTPNSSIQRRTGTLNINLGYLNSESGLPVSGELNIRRFYRTSGITGDTILSSNRVTGLVTIPLLNSNIAELTDLLVNDITIQNDIIFRKGGNVIADMVQTTADIALELDPTIPYYIKTMGTANINSLIQVYPNLNKVVIPNLEAANGEIPYFETFVVDVVNRWNFTGSKGYNLISITADPVLDKILYDVRTNGLLSFRNLQTQQEILNIDTTNNRTIAPNLTTNEITFEDGGTAYSTLEQTATELDLLLDTDFTISTSAKELMRASESGGYVLFPSLRATAATITTGFVTTGTVTTLTSDEVTINNNLLYDLRNNLTAGAGIVFSNVTPTSFTIESTGGLPSNPTFNSVTTIQDVIVGGDITVADITAAGLITAADIDISTSLTVGTSIFTTGNINITGGSLNITTGDINMNTGNIITPGNINGEDITALNKVEGQLVLGETVQANGNVICGDDLTVGNNAVIDEKTTTKRLEYNPSSLFWSRNADGAQPGNVTSYNIQFANAIWDKSGSVFGRSGNQFLINKSGWFKCTSNIQFQKVSGTTAQTVRSFFNINNSFQPARGGTFSSSCLLTSNNRRGNTTLVNTLFLNATELITVCYQTAQGSSDFGVNTISSVRTISGTYILMEYLGGTFSF